jgi:hypothetical protein
MIDGRTGATADADTPRTVAPCRRLVIFHALPRNAGSPHAARTIKRRGRVTSSPRDATAL